MFIIDDSTNNDLLFDVKVDGEVKGRGHDPAQAHPAIFGAPPSEMQLIPRSEWDARIDEQEATQSSLQHLRRAANIPSLDQNGQGYCWAYSTTGTVMMSRLRDGFGYTRLSAHAVACVVKSFRDEGGWCGLSAQFIRNRGVPSVEKWPEKSMSRSHDNAATWQDAAERKILEDWVDLSRSVYDQNLTFDQVATCLLQNIPCAVDFNWWGHSVMAMRLVRVEAGSYGLLILNSWTDSYGDKGEAVLRGSRSIPDGAIATRVAGRAA